MSKQEDELKVPLKVLREDVSSIEVGKYYLKSEFGRISPGDEIRVTIDKRIDSFDDFEFWRLLEGISFSYRLNGVFWYVSNSGYRWSEETWRVSDLTWTGMNPRIDRITKSPEIGQDVIKFRDYLVDYFNIYQEEDPKGLGQFRPRQANIYYPKIILRESENKLLVADGLNRLMAQLLKGKTTIEAFVGREVNPAGKMKVGDSTFLLLRRLYQNSPVSERAAILRVVKRLMEISADGESAVQSYWVDHVQDEELKRVGQSLLTP